MRVVTDHHEGRIPHEAESNRFAVGHGGACVVFAAHRVPCGSSVACSWGIHLQWRRRYFVISAARTALLYFSSQVRPQGSRSCACFTMLTRSFPRPSRTVCRCRRTPRPGQPLQESSLSPASKVFTRCRSCSFRTPWKCTCWQASRWCSRPRRRKSVTSTWAKTVCIRCHRR